MKPTSIFLTAACVLACQLSFAQTTPGQTTPGQTTPAPQPAGTPGTTVGSPTTSPGTVGTDPGTTTTTAPAYQRPAADSVTKVKVKNSRGKLKTKL